MNATRKPQGETRDLAATVRDIEALVVDGAPVADDERQRMVGQIKRELREARSVYAVNRVQEFFPAPKEAIRPVGDSFKTDVEIAGSMFRMGANRRGPGPSLTLLRTRLTGSRALLARRTTYSGADLVRILEQEAVATGEGMS